MGVVFLVATRLGYLLHQWQHETNQNVTTIPRKLCALKCNDIIRVNRIYSAIYEVVQWYAAPFTFTYQFVGKCILFLGCR